MKTRYLESRCSTALGLNWSSAHPIPGLGGVLMVWMVVLNVWMCWWWAIQNVKWIKIISSRISVFGGNACKEMRELIWVNGKEWLKSYSNTKWVKSRLKLTSKLSELVSMEKETLKYRKENRWANKKGQQPSQLLGLSKNNNELIRVVKNKVIAGIKIIELSRELFWL